jgi:hypothetical protein
MISLLRVQSKMFTSVLLEVGDFYKDL